MDLSRQLLKDFADVTRGVEREQTQYLRGTIKGSGEAKYVRIDGSESLTPISEVVDVKEGDRVLVTIENHEATILGNLTKPPSAYKEQEAIDKAEDAQESAEDASNKAENAQTLAKSASDKADAATLDATNASASANKAKQDAAEALTAAGNASTKADEAKNLATTAGQNAATAREEAALAQNAATAAQGEVTRIEGVVTGVKGDIDTALKEVADQAADLQATKETLEVTYAKKTEVSDVQAALTTEISKKVGELQTTVSQTYAAKNDVVAMEGRLQSQITQTSGEVSSVVGKVEQLESDTTEAKKKVDEALEKSAAAQVAAGQAQANATAAQTAADAAKLNADNATKKANEAVQNAANAAATAAEADRKVSAAKTDLDEAKVNLENTMNRVGATEQEIADAQKKVDAAQAAVTQAQKEAAEATLAANNAQSAANQAQTDATEAQNAATNAQKKADNAALAAGNAQAAADKAQQDVAALTKRVTSAETAITQNAEQIKLSANKTEEIGNKLDNLKIGGRNLLTKNILSKFRGSKLTYNSDGSITTTYYYQMDASNLDFKAKAGDTFTFSCKLKKESDFVGKVRIGIYHDGTWDSYYMGDLLTTSYKMFSKTITMKNDGGIGLVIQNDNGNTTDEEKITAKELQLEIGNKATDYTPAFEDMVTQDNLTNNYYSKTQTDAAIKVAADNVTTTVRKEVTTEITNVNNKVDNIKVGGRNILRGTKDMKLGSGKWSDGTWRKSGNGTIKNVALTDFPLADIKQGVEITSYDGRCGVCQDYISLESGYYTLSYYVKANTVGTQVFIHSFWNSEYSGKREYFTLNDTNWTRISVTGNLSVNQKTISAAYIYVETPNAIVTVAAPFEHQSEMVGEWSPAPEDMATEDEVQQAQNDANEANGKADATENRVSIAESTIKQLSDSISMLVTDSNGSSMMTQTSNGWTFNIGSISDAINNATNNISNLTTSVEQANNIIDNLNQLANDLSAKTAYINMTTDETGAPCIELGKVGNDFKVRITNTSVDFIEGSSKIAYVSNQALFIEKAIIKNELQIGDTLGFIWKTRSNGNLGLRYINARTVFTAIAIYPQSNIDLFSTKDRYENFNVHEDPTGCILGSKVKVKIYNTTTKVYNYIECILINVNSTTQIRIQATGVVTLY